ncbi:MAG: hypothetical protein ACRELS_12365 [Candidatus Rokuibacteriota bacterium]
MDQELASRFVTLDTKLAEHDARFTAVDTKLAEHDARFTAVDAKLAEHDTLLARLDARITESAAETRRHFDVIAEALMGQIRLVAEGVRTVDQKLDRFRTEVAAEFRQVDRRLLRLEARVLG